MQKCSRHQIRLRTTVSDPLSPSTVVFHHASPIASVNRQQFAAPERTSGRNSRACALLFLKFPAGGNAHYMSSELRAHTRSSSEGAEATVPTSDRVSPPTGLRGATHGHISCLARTQARSAQHWGSLREWSGLAAARGSLSASWRAESIMMQSLWPSVMTPEASPADQQPRCRLHRWRHH